MSLLSNEVKSSKPTEMSSLKSTNNDFERTKNEDELPQGQFPKFRKLPDELRIKIWNEALPSYGTYTALLCGKEEPMPQQQSETAPLTFRVVYRLEPVPHEQQDEKLRMRLDTMRAIQHTSSEAAAEVKRAFPTTIDCTRGNLRFNAEHDILYLSDLQCHLRLRFIDRFKQYDMGAMIFANARLRGPTPPAMMRSRPACSTNLTTSRVRLEDPR
ncbi:hypothetical protein F5883DRAFT_589707 [Diaporthe sp. PMI_573]|nr:hypothetical protein F5883DRAFT_589707 [Diaporthaceae sp. PMI_573]